MRYPDDLDGSKEVNSSPSPGISATPPPCGASPPGVFAYQTCHVLACQLRGSARTQPHSHSLAEAKPRSVRRTRPRTGPEGRAAVARRPGTLNRVAPRPEAAYCRAFRIPALRQRRQLAHHPLHHRLWSSSHSGRVNHWLSCMESNAHGFPPPASVIFPRTDQSRTGSYRDRFRRPADGLQSAIPRSRTIQGQGPSGLVILSTRRGTCPGKYSRPSTCHGPSEGSSANSPGAAHRTGRRPCASAPAPCQPRGREESGSAASRHGQSTTPRRR